jgi:hypothetical protein
MAFPGSPVRNMLFPIHPDLIKFLRSASRVAVLTGAGVSKESGVAEPRYDPEMSSG